MDIYYEENVIEYLAFAVSWKSDCEDQAAEQLYAQMMGWA